jgi:hypothetical protein
MGIEPMSEAWGSFTFPPFLSNSKRPFDYPERTVANRGLPKLPISESYPKA